MVKTTCFGYDAAGADGRRAAMVYTYARLYWLRGGLMLSLCAFERDPAPPGSRVAFALAGDEALMLAVLGPKRMELRQWPQASRPGLVDAAPEVFPLTARYFSGVDEQGWHWGATARLEGELLARAGVKPEGGFAGALFKFCEGVPALGASYPAGGLAEPLRPEDFGVFEAVGY